MLALVGLIMAINFIWLALTRINVDWLGSRALLPLPVAWLFLLYGLDRTLSGSPNPPVWLERTRDVTAGLVFLSITWPVMRLFNHLTFTIAFPYADEWLLSLDHALGLDWEAYFTFVAARPILLQVFSASYVSLDTLSIAVLVLLLAFGLRARARVFVETFFICALLAAIFGFWLPAMGSVAHVLGDRGYIPSLGGTPGIYFVAHLEALRQPDGEIVRNLRRLPGLVTFPSFHTAAGIILAVTFWRTWFFPAASLYAVIMIAATPIFGGHYFVDLIGGAALAAIALAIATSLPGNRGVLGGGPR